jgi:hypothetical protein
VFVDEGYCSAAAVEFDPDTGCNTYSVTEESIQKDDDWDEEDETEDWEEEDGEEEDDDWLDEEDEF